MASERADGGGSSFAQIVRSSSIIGSASAINIVVSIARLKAAAVLLGPVGVGVIGLLQNIIATASAVGAMGIGASGTRQIAEARAMGDAAQLAASRRALLWLTFGLMLIGTFIFWLLRDYMAKTLLADEAMAGALGWLSLGVGLSIAGTAQTALLLGYRRVGDGARVTIISAVVSSTIGVAVLVLFGERGIIPFLLLPTLTAALAGLFYVRKLPRPPRANMHVPDLIRHWRILALLGLAFMFGGAAALVGQLGVRLLIQRYLGPVELGHFQAVWVLSISYIGFVLQAMGADYYPRLTSEIEHRPSANRLVNEQTEVALLLSAPLLLMMLGTAPWLLELLYSSAFTDAAWLLRWQVLGDLLKIGSWPMGLLLLALGAGRTFVFVETTAVVIFVTFTWLMIPVVRLEAAGIGYFGMYALYLPLLYALAKRKTGLSWTRQVKLLFVLLVAACTSAIFMSLVSDWAALAWSTLLAGLSALYAIRRLANALPAPLAKFVRSCRRHGFL